MEEEAKRIWPKYWDMGYKTDIFGETPLHLLFHGVLDDIVKVLHQFMADHNLAPRFEQYVFRDLSDISALRLEWCKAKTLPKKLWLGENELAYARVMTYMYAQVFLGLEMRQSSETTQETLDDIKRLVNSLHVLICKLMSPREVDSRDIDLHVKIFLSCCDRYSRGYYGQNVDPFWVGKGNFMGLLNLGRQIQTYGKLRWYWEGAHEKFIQPVKTVLVSMRKGTGYLQKKLKLIQKLNTLHWIRDMIRE